MQMPYQNTNASDEPEATLRIRMDRVWLADDLGNLLVVLRELYELRLLIEHLGQEMDWFSLRSSAWLNLDIDSARDHAHRVRDQPLRKSQINTDLRNTRFLQYCRSYVIEALLRQLFGPIHPYYSSMWHYPIVEISLNDLSKLATFLKPEESLRLRRIEFASPGFTDVAGLAKSVKYVGEFLIKIIELNMTRKDRELERQKKAIQIQKEKLRLCRDLIKLGQEANSIGFNSQEIANFVLDRTDQVLIPLIEEKKIKGFEIRRE
jgi:hypothetical protein